MAQNSVLNELRTRLGDQSVLEGDAAAARHFADWSGAPASRADVLILPCAPQDVATALEVCSRFGQRVSVAGGLTGLAGGANPQPGEIVMSLGNLRSIEPVDEIGGTVIVQAGVTLERLQQHVAPLGWFFPLDLGARGSCHLGGNAATNAGGNQVLRFGMMRQSVLGLEVALAGGTLLTMLGRVVKNNAGFDLKHLFIGSEGTLGVITRLSLKLTPLANASRTVLCALPSYKAATVLLREARRSLAGLSSFELMWDNYFDAALRATARNSPLDARYPVYALMETLGADEEAASAGLERMLQACIADTVVQDAVLAQSPNQAKALWAIRDAISELLPTMKPYLAFDVSVPLAEMGCFVDAMQAALSDQYPSHKHLFFGHLGDGNLHLVSGPYMDEKEMLKVEEQVYGAIGMVGGSISAEHGIGVVKKPFLHYSRAANQVALMRSLKQVLDPQAILNVGRIFEPPAR